jgi:hypothetical protein
MGMTLLLISGLEAAIYQVATVFGYMESQYREERCFAFRMQVAPN